MGLCDFLQKRPGSLFSLLTKITASLHARDDASSLTFYLSSHDICVCVCVFSGLLMFGWSVWYVNVMLMHHSNQPSATWRWRRRLSVSHVTSARVCQNLSVELWRRNLWFVLRNSMSSMQFLFLSSFYLAEDSVSCENPGLPDNGYQILSKRLYLPGESLTFVCYQGYELIGEVAIKCILGNPSFWSGPLPLCRGEIFEGHFILIYVIIEIF